MISFFYFWLRGLHREIKSAPCFNHRLVLNGPVYPPLKSEGAAVEATIITSTMELLNMLMHLCLSCKHIEAIKA